MITVVRADQAEFDVRRGISETFAEGFTHFQYVDIYHHTDVPWEEMGQNRPYPTAWRVPPHAHQAKKLIHPQNEKKAILY
jgi:hypothetical protein